MNLTDVVVIVLIAILTKNSDSKVLQINDLQYKSAILHLFHPFLTCNLSLFLSLLCFL